MARHALRAVEPPAETGTVDDARQVDIEAVSKAALSDTVASGADEDAATKDAEAVTRGHNETGHGPVVDAKAAPTAELTPTPAKRGRKPRADAGTPRKAAVIAPKLVPAPVPVGTVPTPPMSVAAALALIEEGTEMTILGATWQDVNAAADELGIRAHIFTRQTEHGVDVDHRAHPEQGDDETE